MNDIVLDASALLALIAEEKGGDIVEQYLPYAIMSTVNVAETATKLLTQGIPLAEIELIISNIVPQIIDYSNTQALITASLKKQTKVHGLSLGDRACLSLAMEYQLPVVTADRVWKKIKLPIDVKLIR